MCATFTDDDIEKRVRTATGEELGTVTDVDDETAHVETDPGVLDSIRATLGWGGDTTDPISIHEDAVDEITTDAIRLETESIAEEDDVARVDPDEADDASAAAGDASSLDDRFDATEQGSGTDLEPDDAQTDVQREAADQPDPDRERAADEDDLETELEDVDVTAAMPEAEMEDEPDESGLEEAGTDAEEATGGSVTTDSASDPAATAPSSEAAATDVSNDSVTTDAASEPDSTASSDSTTSSDSSGSPDRSDPTRAPSEVDGSQTVDEPEPVETPDEVTDDSPGGSTDDSSDEDSAVANLETGIDAESLEDAADSSGGSTDEESAVADLEPGIDAESLEDAADDRTTSDRDVGTESRETDAERTDLADELDAGGDLESAVPPDSSTSPVSEGDDRSAETKSGDASAADVALGTEGTAPESTGQWPETDLRPETTLEADAVASDQRELPDQGDEATDAEADLRAASERGSRISTSPVDAAVAAQRATLRSGQEAMKLGFTAQRSVTRMTIEGPMLAQRSSLELAETATKGYRDAISTMMGLDAGSSGDRQSRRRSTDRSGDDGASRPATMDDTIEGHLEQVREFQAERGADAPPEVERIAALLDRQTELLEECREHLEESR